MEPPGWKRVGDFARRYWRWMLALGFINWIVWIWFERAHSTELGYADLWPVRMYLASGLLLFDNLCVLWWYADRTHRLAQTAEQQLSFQIAQAVQSSKPLVFLNREHARTDGGENQLVARNVGPGIALNVYILAHQTSGAWDTGSIGVLEPGGARHLPAVIDARLEAHAGREPGRVVVSEAINSRTVRWIATLNVADREGSIWHRFIHFEPDQELSLAALMEQYGERFARQLAEFGKEVEGP